MCDENEFLPPSAAGSIVECLPCPQGSVSDPDSSGIRSCICEDDMRLDSPHYACASCPLPAYRFKCMNPIDCEMAPSPYEPGWYATYDIFERCPIQSVCLDACTNQCEYGHIGMACMDCISGHTRTITSISSTCQECPNQYGWIALVVFVHVLFTVIFGGCGYYVWKILKDTWRERSPKNYIVPKLRILIAVSRWITTSPS
eukprot:GHVO01004514.1.p2 GENE.GHVO01004514.1~~GHVO01004514.1.p2  ORF type:complete len:201 (+),score=19.59 GHVO01004514.1:50-652(+)